MNVRRGGLGRGLGALIPTGPEDSRSDEAVPGVRFAELPVADVRPNPRQPRADFDEGSMAELVASIREVGLLQPVVVRETGPASFELVMGERRWRATRAAGLETIPAIIRDTADDAMLRDALLENLHRQSLNPLEEGAAYQQLLQEFGATHDELAQRIGRSRSQVTNTLRLLHLPPSVQRRVAAGVLSAGHARALLSLEDPEAQERLASRVVAEGLSVRAVEEAVSTSEARPTRSSRPGRQPFPRLDAVAEALSDRLDTRVKVDMGRSRGKVVVEFASDEDLDRILGVLGVEVPTAQPPAQAGVEEGCEVEPARVGERTDAPAHADPADAQAYHETPEVMAVDPDEPSDQTELAAGLNGRQTQNDIGTPATEGGRGGNERNPGEGADGSAEPAETSQQH